MAAAKKRASIVITRLTDSPLNTLKSNKILHEVSCDRGQKMRGIPKLASRGRACQQAMTALNE